MNEKALFAGLWTREWKTNVFGRRRWPGAFSSAAYATAAITTYLRPMGSTVPRVYGPSADEP